MKENYGQYEQVLQDHFNGIKLSGKRVRNPEVSLLRVEEGS